MTTKGCCNSNFPSLAKPKTRNPKTGTLPKEIATKCPSQREFVRLLRNFAAMPQFCHYLPKSWGDAVSEFALQISAFFRVSALSPPSSRPFNVRLLDRLPDGLLELLGALVEC